jgi:predicted nuclease of predicted toxin-antitoxin system
MRILFDQGTPVPLGRCLYLAGHSIETANQLGWSSLSNGELISSAEREGFEVLVTTDQNLEYQQSLAGRNLRIIVLTKASWPLIQKHVDTVVTAVVACKPGEFKTVCIAP